MRIAEKKRREQADQRNMEARVKRKRVPGSSFPSTGRWEKENSDEVEMEITSSLFADDTTIIGNSEEESTGLNKVKEIMGRFEKNVMTARRRDSGLERKQRKASGCWAHGWAGRRT